MKIIMYLILLLFASNVYSQNRINGLDYQHILINGNKIELRYSTINDIEKILGSPENIEIHERGSTDFRWHNYIAYSYDNNNLIIDFSQENYVISIQVKSDYSGDVKYFNENLFLLNRVNIREIINKFNNGRIDSSHPQALGWRYTVRPWAIGDSGSDLHYIFVFNSNENVRILSLYYSAPW